MTEKTKCLARRTERSQKKIEKKSLIDKEHGMKMYNNP